MEHYAGPDRSIQWTIVDSPQNPVQWLVIKDHPNRKRDLDIYFWTRLGWVDVHRECKSLYDGTIVDEYKNIVMTEDDSWKQELIAIIEEWLEFVDGKPTRDPIIEP